MRDALGFYILARVTDYLVGRRPFDQNAYFLASNLKAQIIRESDHDTNKFLGLVCECRMWKENA